MELLLEGLTKISFKLLSAITYTNATHLGARDQELRGQVKSASALPH
jgi:hypothetical protein